MIIDRWLADFAERQRNIHEAVYLFRAMNYLLALQALLMGLAFIGPSRAFINVKDHDSVLWYALSYGSVELWDIAFPVGSLFLIFATINMRRVGLAHRIMAAMWIAFGAIWVYSGMTTDMNYLFGLGILAVFIGFQHAIFVQVWESEGIN